MKKLYFLLFLVVILGLALSHFSANAANSPLSVTLDRNHVSLGDTVQMIIQNDGDNQAQPDLRPLQADFDILGRSSGSSVQIINGKMSSKVQLQLVLAPKHAGAIQIPVLTWGGSQSEPMQLTVDNASSNSNNGGANSSAAGGAPVTVTATVNDNEPYVQSAVLLTVRIMTDQPITEAGLELPSNNAFIVQQVGKDQQANETHNGHNFAVITRKYLLFPQQSGTIKLEGPVLQGRVVDTSSQGANNPFGNDPFFQNFFKNSPMAGMMQTTRPFRVNAKDISLEVRPRPASFTGQNWLPALSMKLESSWSPDQGQVHVGEPITLHLNLDALGLTGAQLPDLSTLIAVPDGIKMYPDQAKTANTSKGESILGNRSQDIAFIASKAGHYTLPEFHLSWWDTINNVAREIVVPKHEIEILDGLGASAQTATPSDNQTASPSNGVPDTQSSLQEVASKMAPLTFAAIVAGVIAVLAAAWAIAQYFIRRLRRSINSSAIPVSGQNAGQRIERKMEGVKEDKVRPAALFKEFQKAAQANDAALARRQLLIWAKVRWPDNAPSGLNALAQKLADPKVGELLRELDRCCYTNTPWDGMQLYSSFPLPSKVKSSEKSGEETWELYPN